MSILYQNNVQRSPCLLIKARVLPACRLTGAYGFRLAAVVLRVLCVGFRNVYKIFSVQYSQPHFPIRYLEVYETK